MSSLYRQLRGRAAQAQRSAAWMFVMRTITRSIIGGIVLPFVYLLFVWFVVAIVKALNASAQGDSWWFWLLALPLEGGGRLYNFLFPTEFENPFALLRTPAILADLIGSFLFFAGLTFVALLISQNRKERVDA